MNIYIACALTAVPRHLFPPYVEFIHSLARALSSSGCSRVRYALIGSDPQLADKPYEERARLCYLWDREMVEAADIVIADATFPSIGLGIELQIAEAKGIPIILSFCQSPKTRVLPVEYENPDHSRHTLQIGDGYASLMARGLPTVFKTIAYPENAVGISMIVEAVSLFRKDNK